MERPLSQIHRRRDLILSLNGAVNVAMSGTVTNNGVTLTGAGTDFTKLNVGDKIEIAGISGTYFIADIASGSIMNVSSAFAGNVSGAAYVKVYKTGDIIDLTRKRIDRWNREKCFRYLFTTELRPEGNA